VNYLVTGGCGFIGSHLVDSLVKGGDNVIVIDNLSAESNEKFYYNQSKSVSYHNIDILDYDKILPLFEGIDAVFHFAAESKIHPILNNPRLAANVNTIGTCNILEASRIHGVKRIMYSSTSAVYGLKNESPLNEEMETDCLNSYSVSKKAGEDFCKLYNRMWGMEIVIFRYFNVFGERQPTKGQYAPVISLFMHQKNMNEPMTIVGDGNQTRDFIHVNDIVSANILASKSSNPKIFGEVLNVGSGQNISVNEIADLIGGKKIHIPRRPAESRETLADNSKIRNLLGWSSTISVQDWITSNINS
jgi:UDP-glucose 4-epimerase